MKLYHGSNIVIDQIDLSKCKPYKSSNLTKQPWTLFQSRYLKSQVKSGPCSLWLIVAGRTCNRHIVLTLS